MSIKTRERIATKQQEFLNSCDNDSHLVEWFKKNVKDLVEIKKKVKLARYKLDQEKVIKALDLVNKKLETVKNKTLEQNLLKEKEKLEKFIKTYDDNIEKLQSNTTNKPKPKPKPKPVIIKPIVKVPKVKVKPKFVHIYPFNEKFKQNAERIKRLEIEIEKREALKLQQLEHAHHVEKKLQDHIHQVAEAIIKRNQLLESSNLVSKVYVLDTWFNTIAVFESINNYSETNRIPIHKIENALANKSSIGNRYFVSFNNLFQFNTAIKPPVLEYVEYYRTFAQIRLLPKKSNKKPNLSFYDNRLDTVNVTIH